MCNAKDIIPTVVAPLNVDALWWIIRCPSAV
jgi:hypothetical protein